MIPHTLRRLCAAAVLIVASSAHAQAPQPPAEKKDAQGGRVIFGVGGMPAPRSFVFVVDRTAALEKVAKHVELEIRREWLHIRQAKAFNIVWFGEGEPGAAFPAMVAPTEANQTAATDRLGTIRYAGKADAVAALLKAFAMNPDFVVFFGDANFDGKVLEKLIAARPNSTRLHSFLFTFPDSRGRENLLKLTRDSRDRLTVADVPELIRMEKEGRAVEPPKAAPAPAIK